MEQKVYEQHLRYYRKRGYVNTDPFFKSDKDFLKYLWQIQGEEVLLMIDLNQHILNKTSK